MVPVGFPGSQGFRALDFRPLLDVGGLQFYQWREVRIGMIDPTKVNTKQPVPSIPIKTSMCHRLQIGFVSKRDKTPQKNHTFQFGKCGFLPWIAMILWGFQILRHLFEMFFCILRIAGFLLWRCQAYTRQSLVWPRGPEGNNTDDKEWAPQNAALRCPKAKAN